MTADDWRTPEDTKADRAALTDFTCTTPRRSGRTPHPKPWEHLVQGIVRNRLLNDTARHKRLDQRIRVREDGLGLSAVFAHVRSEDEVPPGLDAAPDTPVRILLIAAVSVRHRGAGGHHADETILEALHDILDSEPGADRVLVLAFVDHRNRASQHLLDRHGFRLYRASSLDSDYEVWEQLIGR